MSDWWNKQGDGGDHDDSDQGVNWITIAIIGNVVLIGFVFWIILTYGTKG
jgi:hypothetical protein